MNASLLQLVGECFQQNQTVEGFLWLESGRAGFYTRKETTSIASTVYQPFLCINLQGEKLFYNEDQKVIFEAGDGLIVGKEMPITGQISRASTDAPFVAIILRLDLEILRRIYHQFDAQYWAKLDRKKSRGCVPISIAPIGVALEDALQRYILACRNEAERDFMEPLIFEEIQFRALSAPNGAMLRRFFSQNEEEMRISRVMERLKTEFRLPLSVSDLARGAGMSISAFHRAFKNVTGVTPLQYQKDLRMSEAQKLLAQGDLSVSQVAYEIGYQSPSQFSREYSRRFQEAPTEHRGRLIEAG